MRWIGKLEYLETCPIDYLADHHNRPGELLLGVPFSPSDTNQQVLDTLCTAAQQSEFYADAFPSSVFHLAVEAWEDSDGEHPAALFWTHRDDGKGGAELPPGADDDDSDVQHWFLFTWEREHAAEPGEVVTLEGSSRFAYAALALPGGGFIPLSLDLGEGAADRPNRYVTPDGFTYAPVRPMMAEALHEAKERASAAYKRHEAARGVVVYQNGRFIVRRKPEGNYVIENPDKPGEIIANGYQDGNGGATPWRVYPIGDVFCHEDSRRYKTERGVVGRMRQLADFAALFYNARRGVAS